MKMKVTAAPEKYIEGPTTLRVIDCSPRLHVTSEIRKKRKALVIEALYVLRQATSESAEVIRMAGKLIRYDNFGEVRVGWLADLLLIEGDPFEDISILEHPDESLAVIMKAGKIVKGP